MAEWTMKDEECEDDEDDDFLIHTLYVKLATLGKNALKNEENIVEIETMNFIGEIVKQPMLNLVSGVNNTVAVDISFSSKNKVIFRLSDGSGPVYLSGQHLVEMPDDGDMSQDSMYTEDTGTEEDVSEDEGKGGKKKSKAQKRRTSSSPGKGNKAKRSKLDEESDSEDDYSDDDEDEDEDDMEDSGKKKKGKAAAGKKAAKKDKGPAKAAKKPKKVAAKK
nr:hypothetical protein BaRGS_018419 [Batillaria attramentaria]